MIYKVSHYVILEFDFLFYNFQYQMDRLGILF